MFQSRRARRSGVQIGGGAKFLDIASRCSFRPKCRVRKGSRWSGDAAITPFNFSRRLVAGFISNDLDIVIIPYLVPLLHPLAMRICFKDMLPQLLAHQCNQVISLREIFIKLAMGQPLRNLAPNTKKRAFTCERHYAMTAADHGPMSNRAHCRVILRGADEIAIQESATEIGHVARYLAISIQSLRTVMANHRIACTRSRSLMRSSENLVISATKS